VDKENKPKKIGVRINSNGTILEGLFNRGRANNYGREVCHEKQEINVGEWLEDKRHGQGELLCLKTASTYEGEFSHGLKSGFGRESFADGAKYKGSYKDGKKFGRGTIVQGDGVIVEGVFNKNGNLSG
jgi:hypothetical protein